MPLIAPSQSALPPDSLTRASQLGCWLLVLASLALGCGEITHLDVGIGDEDVHRFQINWFLEGRYEVFENVTVLPL